MANTYTQLHIQFVFAVRYRAAVIAKNWKEQLHQYITGIIRENGHKVLQVNSQPDHIHIFFGLRPEQSISSLAQHIKAGATKWIKAQGFCKAGFAWQTGYGAFSCAKSQVPDVIRYIQNQDAHHKKINFLDEYKAMLEKFEISYDEQYIFKELE